MKNGNALEEGEAGMRPMKNGEAAIVGRFRPDVQERGETGGGHAHARSA